MSKQYRLIPGYEQYSIDEDGRVYNGGMDKQVQPKFSGKTMQVNLYDPKTRKAKGFPVCKLILMSFVGPAPTPKATYAFKDGNAYNTNYKNLEWDTFFTQVAPVSRLTREEIRIAYRSKRLNKDQIRRLYKISYQCLETILTRDEDQGVES